MYLSCCIALYVCVYMWSHVCFNVRSVHTCIYPAAKLYIFVFICSHACVSMRTVCICVFIWLHSSICLCLYVVMCVHQCAHCAHMYLSGCMFVFICSHACVSMRAVCITCVIHGGYRGGSGLSQHYNNSLPTWVHTHSDGRPDLFTAAV